MLERELLPEAAEPAGGGWTTTAAKVVHVVSLIVLAAFVVGWVLNGSDDEDFHPIWAVATLVVIGGFSTVGRVIVIRARNRIGWIFMAIAGLAAISLPADGYVMASYAASSQPTLPFTSGAAWLSNVGNGVVAMVLPLLFLLFPTGRVPGRRWRWVFRLWLVGAVVSGIWLAFRPGEILGEPGRMDIANPLGVPALDAFGPILSNVGVGAVLAASVLSIASLVVRFRRSRGDERQLLKWLMLVGIVAIGLFGAMVVDEVLSERGVVPSLGDVLWPMFVLTLAIGIPLAVAIAVLRYRLYDIDLVIRKSLVFATLAVFITGVYVAIVAGVGALLGGRASTELSFAAAALLAVLFQPARERARRLADRLVYGHRATPYEALSSLSDRIGDAFATEDILPRMAATVAAGTGASTATVSLYVDGELREVATWPDDGATQGRDAHGFEVRHQGELLGAIAVSMPQSDPMDPAKAKLVHDLAAQAGLVLRNVRLVEDLRASRQRLVAAQDEERRKIERNLHDGAQQHLVALAVQLKLAEQMVGRDPTKEREIIHRVQNTANEALEELRDLARGIYPPLLEDKGLAAAIDAHAARLPIAVSIETDDVRRYRPEVESALYFCALEALNNVVKYANADNVTVALRDASGVLVMSVTDDGAGFDTGARREGTGLRGMADRLDAIGGHLNVRSAPGGGTTVVASVSTAGHP